MTVQKQPLGVFCGPSLPRAARLAIPGVSYLPPAARGSVESAAREFDALLLIDGVFHHDLAPSPTEVFEACKRVRMFGAASMGALRAAECWPFGMVPLGIIVRWYIAERIDGDDEVAQLVHPQTQVGLTVPLVNVRYVAWLARRRGILSQVQAQRWIGEARAVYYMDRGWDCVLACAPEPARDRLAEIARGHGDLKGLDARFALKSAARRLRLRGPWAKT